MSDATVQRPGTHGPTEQRQGAVGAEQLGGPSQVPILPIVRLGARAALTLPLSQLAAQEARAKGARWLVAAGPDLAEALAAVRQLWQANVGPDQLFLHCRFVAPRDLQQLWRCGVRQLAWSVQAVNPAHPGFEALADAARQAKRLGFYLQLRWTVSSESAKALGELASPAVAALGCDEVVLQPDLTPGQTPSAQLLLQHWPVPNTMMPRLIVSQLWPRCLPLPCSALEPVADVQAAEVAQQPPCASCPAARQCPGIAAAVRAAWGTLAEPWRGMAQDRATAGPAPATGPAAGAEPASGAGGVRFSRESIEMRGLRMGLRDAWRLRVASGDLANFAAAARSDGWQVAWTEQSFVGHAGGKMTRAEPLGAEAAHVVVVARSEALAQRCVADELELLRPDDQRSPPAVAARIAAHERLGAAYGFPGCCVQAFCDAFGEVVYTDRIGDNAVAVLRAALRSKYFDPRCFTLVAGLGQPSLSPLRHLPCRFDCPASVHLAEQLQPEAPPAWPVIVWADGSFAIVQGQLGGDGGVSHVQGCQVFGFDPADSHNGMDRKAFAEPLRWTDLQVRAGLLQLDPAPGQVSVPPSNLPWSQQCPLLLPFGAAAPSLQPLPPTP